MPKPWREVASSPDYLNLPEEDRVAARKQYFDEVVAPRVPKPELGSVWAQFDADTADSLTGKTPRAPVSGKPMMPSDRRAQEQPDEDTGGFFDSAKKTYLGASLKSGVENLGGTAAKALDTFNPFTLSEQDAAVLFKNDPDKLTQMRDKSPAMALGRFSRIAQQASEKSMQDISPEAKKDYGSLQYATLDTSKAAYLSPIKMIGDAVQSLPTTLALAVSAYFTKNVAASVEAQALKAGATQEAAREMAVKAASETMAKVGAGTEGAAGFGQQANQMREQADRIEADTLKHSPEYQQLIAKGFTPEAARTWLSAVASDQSGAAGGIADAITNYFGGKVLGKIIGEGGALVPRTLKGYGTEAVTEAVQSGLEQLGQNQATKQYLDHTQSLLDGVAENVAQGFFVGGLMGGTTSAIAGRRTEPAPPGEHIPADQVIDQEPPGPPGTVQRLAAPRQPLLLTAPQPEMIVGENGQARPQTAEEASEADFRRRMAAEVARYRAEELGNTSPDATRSSLEAELEARKRALASMREQADDAAHRARTHEEIDLAYQEREHVLAEQKQADLDRLAGDARVERGETPAQHMAAAEAAGAGLRPDAQTGMESAMQAAGVAPAQFPSTRPDAETRAITGVSNRVLNTPAPDLSDGILQMVARKGTPKAKAIAQTELDRRVAAREERPDVADQPIAEKLYTKQRLTQEEQRRAMLLGWGYRKPNGKWSFTRRAQEYRKAMKEGTLWAGKIGENLPPQTLFRRNSDATDQSLVERARAATGAEIELAADVPLSADARAGVQIAESFGKRVVFFKGAKGTSGFVLADDPKTIYVNVKSKTPHLAIIGHELLHSLRRTNGAVYGQLLDRIKPLMREVAEYRQWLRTALEDEGHDLTDKQIDDLTHEELIADFLGDHMMQEKFWVEVFRGQEKTWVQKVKAAIDVALGMVRLRLQIGSKTGLGTERYIRDAEGVRRALAAAFNAWQQQQQAEKPTLAERVKPAEKPAPGRTPTPTPRPRPQLSEGMTRMLARVRKTEGADTSRGVNVEVAPNPADVPLTDRFNKLTETEKKDATYAVAHRVIPLVMADMGITDFGIEYTIGGYKGDTNPSIVLHFGSAVPYDTVIEAGKVVGWAFQQEAVIGYDENVTKGEGITGFVKVAPSRALNYEEQSALFKAIGQLVPEAEGFTARDGALVFGNFAGIEDEVFHDKIHAALGLVVADHDYDADARIFRFRSDWVQPVTLEGTRYGQSNAQQGEAGRDTIRWQGRADSFQAEANSIFRNALEAERGAAREERNRQGVDAAAHQAATSPKNELPEPSEAQKIAGVYQKGHVRVNGLDIAIENPAGSHRRPEWPVLKSHYGYIKRTEGNDGDHVDVFVKSGTPLDYNGPVFVVDQFNKDGAFDEHKVMLGWPTMPAAHAGYLENYTKGWTGVGAIQAFTMDEFKAWLDGDTKAPASVTVLKSRERAATQTPEFKRWFGDSKVVDKDGKPLVVYHGTQTDIGAFDPTKTYDAGLYFTDNPDAAVEYGAMAGPGGANDAVTMPVYVAIKNPFVIEYGGRVFATKTAREVKKRIQEFKRTGEHDGIIINSVDDVGDGGDNTMYIALEPTQIKSAIGNSGAFDPAMPNILKSRERQNPAARFDVRLHLEKNAAGDWVSEDGRFELVRSPNGGYYARVDGSEIAWRRDFASAKKALEEQHRRMVVGGTATNPASARSIASQYTAEQRDTVVSFWRALSKVPGVQKYRASGQTDIRDILRDLRADDHVVEVRNEKNWTGRQIEIHFDDATRAVINVDLEDTAYLDAHELERNGYGTPLYQAVLTWAANNKVKLVPDPNGLSFINTFRRTEQMFSAALRSGTTKYMSPHADQGLFGWNEQPQTQADEDANLAILALTAYENIYQGDKDQRAKVIAEISQLRYNFEHRRFEENGQGDDAGQGKPVPRERWDQLAQEAPSRAIGSGVATLKRAVLTQSLLAELGNGTPRGQRALDVVVSHLPLRSILDEGDSLGGVLYARQRNTGGGAVSRPAGQGGAVRRAALAAARGATLASRLATAPLDLANRGIEAAIKLPAKLLLAPITSRIYDRVVGLGQWFAKSSKFGQQVAHGLTADYGLPEPYLTARNDRETAINRNLRQSKNLIDRIAGLTRAESRVAYLWMQEKPNEATERALLAQLPAESQQALAQMKDAIDALGQEAVRLGLMSAEAMQRNRMAYLHRTYAKHELEDPQAASRGQQAKAIRANTYRGRGLREDVAQGRLPGVTQGAKYIRMELRDPSTTGLGAIQRVVYLPAGLPVPTGYAGWRKDGVWEARWMPTNAGEPIGLWRDLTPEERTRLGEIEEVRYSFARTMLATSRDIETARFLDWVHKTYAKSEAEVEQLGGVIAEATDSMVTLTTYADNEWVKVPSGFAAGTRIPKYGMLAGAFVPGHIWNDIRSTINFKSNSAVWALYDELLKAWKISKTALSPAVHTNNVMSNFVLADMADVQLEDLRGALRTILDAKRGDTAALATMETFYDSGAEGASHYAIELRGEVIEPLLAELKKEQDGTLGMLSLMQALSLAARGNIRQSLAAMAAMRGTQLAAAPFKAMIDAYRSEDSVFRLAKFMHDKKLGRTDREAGAAARAAFLDYNINAPWIQAVRRGPLPFLAFTYRVIPLLAESAAKKPWKMLKYMGVGMALNALAYAMLGSDGDEDKERRLLPEEKSGRALGIFARMLRMPWNDEHGSPVFLDVRRWVPGGDIFDVTGSKSAVPLPQWLTVGGPIALFVEMVSNKDSFTGKPIWSATDTTGEATLKIMDHLYKFIAPNLPIPNPAGYAADASVQERGIFQTYSWKSIQAAGTGETDGMGRERDLAQAMAGSVGVKVGSYPADIAKQNLVRERDAKLREISQKENEYRREKQRGGIDTEGLQSRMTKQRDKRDTVQKDFRDRLGLDAVTR